MEGGCSSFIPICYQFLRIFQEGLMKSFSVHIDVLNVKLAPKATPLGDHSHLADKKRCDCLVDLPEGKAFDTNVIMYEYLRLTVSLWVQPSKIFTLAVWRLAPTFGKPELNLIGYWLRYMFPSLKWGNSRPHSTQDSSFGNAGKRGMKHQRTVGSFL